MTPEQKAMLADLALILERLLRGESEEDDAAVCHNIAVRLRSKGPDYDRGSQWSGGVGMPYEW